jgi:hypothetical protein
MRKFVLALALLSTLGASAQSKLGLKFSPIISSSRITLVDSVYDVEQSASKVAFSLGLIYDHQISETYFISTGLIYLPKSLGYNLIREDGAALTSSADGKRNPTESYKVQYLQIPTTLKLFTNEILPDGKIFFQVGTALEFLVNSLPRDEDYDQITEFKKMDFSVILGTGFEYRAGINTTIFAEVSYQRGLVNQIKALQNTYQEELFIRSNLVSIDLGIKF